MVEPCNYLVKFPDPLAYFFEARGFSLLESYYQSLQNPYQGIIAAEPLAEPFAQPGAGQWIGLSSNSLLTGTASLTLNVAAADGQHPVQQVDLFVDGTWLETLTNLPPAPGKTLFVTVNDVGTNLVVPEAASVPAIAAALSAALNNLSNETRVVAMPSGDRIELQSTDLFRPGAQTLASVSNWIGGAPDLTTFIATSRPDFLDRLARGYGTFQVSGSAAAGDVLTVTVTKTNGDTLTLSVTNPAPPSSPMQLCQQLLALINATPALRGTDGVPAEDTLPDGCHQPRLYDLCAKPGPGCGASSGHTHRLHESADLNQIAFDSRTSQGISRGRPTITVRTERIFYDVKTI